MQVLFQVLGSPHKPERLLELFSFLLFLLCPRAERSKHIQLARTFYRTLHRAAKFSRVRPKAIKANCLFYPFSTLQLVEEGEAEGKKGCSVSVGGWRRLLISAAVCS